MNKSIIIFYTSRDSSNLYNASKKTDRAIFVKIEEFREQISIYKKFFEKELTSIDIFDKLYTKFLNLSKLFKKILKFNKSSNLSV